MHVGEDGDFVEVREVHHEQDLLLLAETTTAVPTTQETTTTIPIEVEYEASIFSHTDFEIVIITRGANYDLLYSVELTDSLLGTCVYTDQSLLYKANSTIITETDGSYRTEITLTVPGSTDHDTYLSERTISLSKILFTRDTADGTFPADIPSNTTTSLLFEVHAKKYFDPVLGLPLEVNEAGKVDIIVMPEGDFYAEAETLAKTAVVIPGTINGHQVGEILLWDADWLESLEINGASENVLLLGDFAELSTVSIMNLSRLVDEEEAYLIFDGVFTSLEEVTVSDSADYRISLIDLPGIEISDERYNLYYTTHEDGTCEFPALASLSLSGVSTNQFRLGSPTSEFDLSSLTSISITESVIGSANIGAEPNLFPLLASIMVTDSLIGSLYVSGTMPVSSTPATIEIVDSEVYYVLSVSGSIVGDIDITGSDFADLEVLGGNTLPSKFTSLTIAESVFDATGTIQIKDDHPLLSELSFSGTMGRIIIGSVEDTFASLSLIEFESVVASSIKIGDRDTSFPALLEMRFNDVVLTEYIRIGYETSEYDLLERISFIGLEADEVTIGWYNDDFGALEIIYCEDVTIIDTFTIQGGSGYTGLTTVVCKQFSAYSFSHQGSGGAFDIYFEDYDSDLGPFINSDCDTVYVPNADVTTWEYYTIVHLAGHTIESGVYVPSS